MKKAIQALTRFEKHLCVSTKIEKRWFRIAFLLLALYFGYAVYAQNFNRGYSSAAIVTVCALAVIPLCVFSVWLFGRMEIAVVLRDSGNRAGIAVFITVFLITLSIMLTWVFGLWPGSFSPDSIEQYTQSLTGEYNDWHPVLHTWLFFSVPMMFSDSPAVIIIFQLVWFALSCAYLYYVLYTSGCPKGFMLVSWIYIVANPNTAQIMLYPWKDSAFTILSLVTFSHLIRIYESDGKWLHKWYNIVVFSLFLFLTNGVRHNAILLIAPILLVLLIFIKNARNQVAAAAAVFIVATLILKLPIYSFADVGSPKHRTTEIMGLPMTIISDVYMEDREALSDEATEFLSSLASEENWEKYHSFGNFNSLKWSDGTIYDKIDEEGALSIIGYALDAAENSPEVAKKSFFQLTKMVWSFDGGNGWTIGYGITANEQGISAEYNKDAVEKLNEYRSFANSYLLKYVFNYIGVIILVLLFVAVARLGKSGLGRFFAVMPIMVYNFGTMLLLTGHDFRFFHLNFVIVVPLLYIMLTKRKE